MKTSSHHLKIAAVLLSAGAALTGCVVAPTPGPVYGGPAYPVDSVYAPVAPPAPYTEVIPVVPFPGAIWVGGYWNWSGGRHVWVPGRYERPRAGYHYQPRHWEPSRRGGWELHGGGWIR